MFLNIFLYVWRLVGLNNIQNRLAVIRLCFLLIQHFLFDVAQVLILNFWYTLYKICGLSEIATHIQSGPYFKFKII